MQADRVTVIDGDEFAEASTDPRTLALIDEAVSYGERLVDIGAGRQAIMPDDFFMPLRDRFGATAARAWWAAPNPALDTARPVDLVTQDREAVTRAMRLLLDQTAS